MNHVICKAIANRQQLRLSYSGWHLDPAGWKLLRVDEIRLLALLPNPVPEPRPDYRRGDKDIWLIYCQF